MKKLYIFLLKSMIGSFYLALRYDLMVGLIENEFIAWEELHYFWLLLERYSSDIIDLFFKNLTLLLEFLLLLLQTLYLLLVILIYCSKFIIFTIFE